MRIIKNTSISKCTSLKTPRSGLASVGTKVYAAPHDSPQLLFLDLTYGGICDAGPQGTWNGSAMPPQPPTSQTSRFEGGRKSVRSA